MMEKLVRILMNVCSKMEIVIKNVSIPLVVINVCVARALSSLQMEDHA